MNQEILRRRYCNVNNEENNGCSENKKFKLSKKNNDFNKVLPINIYKVSLKNNEDEIELTEQCASSWICEDQVNICIKKHILLIKSFSILQFNNKSKSEIYNETTNNMNDDLYSEDLKSDNDHKSHKLLIKNSSLSQESTSLLIKDITSSVTTTAVLIKDSSMLIRQNIPYSKDNHIIMENNTLLKNISYLNQTKPSIHPIESINLFQNTFDNHFLSINPYTTKVLNDRDQLSDVIFCDHYRCLIIALMIAGFAFIVGHLLHDVVESLIYTDLSFP